MYQLGVRLTWCGFEPLDFLTAGATCLLLGIWPREINTYPYKHLYTSVHSSCFEQPYTGHYSDVHQQWVLKLCYLHMNVILQAIKQNEVSIYAATWMPLKVIMLTEKEARKEKEVYSAWKCESVNHLVVSNSLGPHGL